MQIDVTLDDARWDALRLTPLAEIACNAVLSHLSLVGLAEISLLGTDDRRIATLNAEFRGKPRPTNVLSWPAQDLGPGKAPRADPDGSVPLGDIAISYDTCAREAEAGGLLLADHVTHLIVHGTLHLLGYDHENDTDAELMERLEVEILGKMGIDDPYRAG